METLSLTYMTSMTYMGRQALSLFSGAGGDSLGLTRCGWKVTHFSELDSSAVKTHQANFPDSVLIPGDIRSIPDSTFESLRGQIDLIFAGFPCQGFSHAGKKREDDPRNELVYEFARAVDLIRPRWIVGENVKGLLSRQSGGRPVINLIEDIFNSIGYQFTWGLVKGVEWGLPQTRERVLMVGCPVGETLPQISWSPPKVRPPTPIRSIISWTLDGALLYHGDLPGEDHDISSFFISGPGDHDHAPGEGHPAHPNLARLMFMNDDQPLLSYGRRVSPNHGEILNLDAPCKTIICTYRKCPRLFVGMTETTGSVVDYYVRVLTLSELAQIQGFPPEYQFVGTDSQIITQIGNAIPPPMVEAIVRQLLEIDK